MTIKEFKDKLAEEIRNKLRKNNLSTPILDRLELHVKDFEDVSVQDIIGSKNMRHDVYVSFIYQICYPSRIKMDIDENYQPITKKRIAIVNCKSRKQDYTCSADEMYDISHHYKAQRNFFIKGYDDYYIISSKYGIIHHNQIIEPYDIRLSRNSFDDNNKIQGWDEDKLSSIKNQMQWMIDKGWEIDFHTSRIYYNYLPQEIKDNIRYIKQPRGIVSVAPTYNEASDMLDSKNLEECLEFISSKKDKKHKPEVDTWFHHPKHGSFFGKSMDLCKKYNGVNQGNLFRVAIGQFTHAVGWVIDESLLPNLYQTESGQWRLKKQK